MFANGESWRYEFLSSTHKPPGLVWHVSTPSKVDRKQTIFSFFMRSMSLKVEKCFWLTILVKSYWASPFILSTSYCFSDSSYSSQFVASFSYELVGCELVGSVIAFLDSSSSFLEASILEEVLDSFLKKVSSLSFLALSGEVKVNFLFLILSFACFELLNFLNRFKSVA